jgi:transposase
LGSTATIHTAGFTLQADSTPRNRRVIAEKKFRQFVAVIVDHDHGRVLEVLENREKTTIVAYLTQAKLSGLLSHVEEVTTDMWDGYVAAAQEVFGVSVQVTIDRFHVMKNFQECFTKARRELQNRLPEESRQKLKGSRWLWLTNTENLSVADRELLAELKREYPELGQLADQRDRFQMLFEDRGIRSSAEGVKELSAWRDEVLRLGLKALEPFCRTLTNWMEMIANYFVNRSSNGRVEGFNHRIRSILWRAFGMVNFSNFRLRVLDALGR